MSEGHAWKRVLGSGLPAPSILVALSALNHSGRKTGRPPTWVLVEETSLSIRAIQIHLRSLERLGVIRESVHVVDFDVLAALEDALPSDRHPPVSVVGVSQKRSSTAPPWVRVLFSDLGWQSKLVLLALIKHANARFICSLKLETMSSLTGMSPRTVRTYLKQLEAVGAVTITPGRVVSTGRNGACSYKVDMRVVDECLRLRDKPNVTSLGSVDCPESPAETIDRRAPVAGYAHQLPRSSASVATLKRTSCRAIKHTCAEATCLKQPKALRALTPPVGDVVQEPATASTPTRQIPASEPTEVGRAESKPVTAWNNRDVALDFSRQAARYFPARYNRCDVRALAGGLSKARSVGHTAEMHVAMIDAFFGDMNRGLITDTHPLWVQFLASLDRLKPRAELTLDQHRRLRQGYCDHEVKPEQTRLQWEAEYREIHGQTEQKWLF